VTLLHPGFANGRNIGPTVTVPQAKREPESVRRKDLEEARTMVRRVLDAAASGDLPVDSAEDWAAKRRLEGVAAALRGQLKADK